MAYVEINESDIENQESDEASYLEINEDDIEVGEGRGFLPFLSRSIANIAQAPAQALQDVQAPTMEYVGIEPSNISYAEDAMRAVGIPMAERGASPETISEYAGEGAGLAASLAIPGGMAMKGASKAPGFVGRIADDIHKSFSKNPSRFLAAETALGGISGAGGYVGKQAFPDSQYGELAGNIGAPIGVSAAYNLGAAPIKFAFRSMAPFTESGGRQRASQRVRGLVPDPEEAAKNISESTSKLTPAQKSREKGLLQLEKAVRQESNDIDNVFAEQAYSANKDAIDEIEAIRGLGSLESGQEFISQRRNRLFNALEDRMMVAAAKADEAIAKSSPDIGEVQASSIAKNELSKALADARAQERQLYESIPKEVSVPTDESMAVFNSLKRELGESRADYMPNIAKKLLDISSKSNFGSQTSVNEMHGLRSRLLEEARLLRSEGKYSAARVNEDLADAALKDLMKPSKASEPLSDALAFSRELNEKFRSPNVSKILGTSRTGQETLPEELALRRTMGAGKIPGMVAFDEIVQAAPPAKKAASEYILNEFQNVSVSPEGRLNVNRAEKFLRDNADLLQKNKQVLRPIQKALNAEKSMLKSKSKKESIFKSLTSKQKSRTAAFLDLPVEQAFDSVLSSQQSKPRMREIVRQVNKSNDPLVKNSLKSGAADYLLGRATTVDPINGSSILSGKSLKSILNNPKVRDAFSEIFSDKELDRLNKIADEILIREAAESVPGTQIMDDVVSKIIEIPARVLGAKAGAAVSSGGASIQSAAIGSGTARNFMKRLTSDKAEELLIRATQDDDLMKALLLDLDNQKNVKFVNKKLNSWLGTSAGRAFMQSEEEDQE